MGGSLQFLHRAGKWIVPQVTVRFFLHFLKAEAGLAFARRLVKDTLRFQDPPCGDGLLCRVQLIRCPVRAPDRFPQIRGCQFLVRELQPGRRAASGLRSCPDRFRVRPGRLLCLVPVMGVGGTFRRCLRRLKRLPVSGEIRFRLPAADICHLARGQVFRHGAVMGHLLRDLIRCFQLLHALSPAFP